MEVSRAIKNRRSIREFQKKEIPGSSGLPSRKTIPTRKKKGRGSDN